MKGLWNKYIITKSSGKPLAEGFFAIVLRIDGGQYLHACRAGVAAFAEAVREHNPVLANDLQMKLMELLPDTCDCEVSSNRGDGICSNYERPIK